jgi:phage shock protein C
MESITMPVRRTRFYLDKQHARIAGVCAGIADFTGISTRWVRIGAVVLTALGGFPWTVIAYFVVAWLAEVKPSELVDLGVEETRFWQGVRTSPRRSVREVHSSFRDLDRRLADIEAHVTSSSSRLAREIDNLR